MRAWHLAPRVLLPTVARTGPGTISVAVPRDRRWPLLRTLPLLGCVLLAPRSGTADRLLDAETTVLLISGLPGDVESERAYEGQATAFLDALATAGVKDVRVLVDAPDRVQVPAGLRGRVGVGSRAAVLSTADELAPGTGPVVVVAWGHGGQQGATPVLHVRGPRLTPQDFASLATRWGRRPSRWLLFFRGSGAFARALRGDGRQVLASDNEVAFRSDPIGQELLGRILRDGPGQTLPAISERLGQATTAWYADQHLARTEEPTLWSGNEAPRALAAASPPPADAAPQARGEAWAGIAPLPADRYAGRPAVVLRRTTRYALGRTPALVQEVDEFVQVLTEEGKSRGDLDILYSPPEERVTILDAEVLRADGVLERLGADAVRDTRPEALPDGYRAPSRKVFSLPGVAAGAILRLHYRSEWRTFPLPEILLEVPVAWELPVAEATVEVHVAADAAFHHAFQDAPPQAPTVRRSPYGVIHVWRFRDVPPLLSEALARPGFQPRLLCSTFPDWAAFAAWYRRLVQEADAVTPEIEARAALLTRGARTDREKVVALYDFVTALRYVAIPLGVNSHRPHAASSVLKNRYGDCKDKANLFNTLLRTQGIAADLVLVPRFTQAHEGVPGAGFNHAISRVRLGGEVLWVDTTDDVSRFGLLPPGDPGRNVLVVDGGAAVLTTLPAPDPAAHRLSLDGTLALGPDDAAAGTLLARATGYADYGLRTAARMAESQATTRPILGEEYRPAAGLFAMESQEGTAVSALDRDFAWNARGSWSGLLSALPGSGRLLRAPFWLPREWESALHPRRTALYLNQGYPLTVEQRYRITLPPGAGRPALPAPRSNEAGPLRYSLRWTLEGDGAVLAALRFEVTRGELDERDTGAFQGQLRGLMAAVSEGTTFGAQP
jgi:transglutaminase-like putative cysteine protease